MSAPPLMRPPGANRKAHRIPLLKIQTPQKPTNSVSVPTSVNIPSSNSNNGAITKSSPLPPMAAGSLYGAGTTKKKKPHITINTRPQNDDQNQQSGMLLLDPAQNSENPISANHFDLATIRSSSDDNDGATSITTKSSYENVTSSSTSRIDSTELNVLETFSSLTIKDDHIYYSRSNSARSSLNESKEYVTKKMKDLSENDWKELADHDYIDTVAILGEGNGGSVKKLHCGILWCFFQ
ncbi:unnamed protein product [Ambrosiozyma monospora]|uniref:Unnamed protein product n=1 Tax=Ambrosiozyma monospora TaxID=43982 RepID=A0ACB5T9P2_AMBMO|nr:unnamed protein product [Ambrosiozyma monospora]